MPHQIVDASEIEAVNGVFKPLRHSLGVTAFGINQLELPPNAEGPEHDHGEDGQEEVYAIVRGGGTIRVEGEERELNPGKFVFLAPGTPARWSPAPTGSPGSRSAASRVRTERRRPSRRRASEGNASLPTAPR